MLYKPRNKKLQIQSNFWKENQTSYKSKRTEHGISDTGGNLLLICFEKLGWSRHFHFMTFLVCAKAYNSFVIILPSRCCICARDSCPALCKFQTRVHPTLRGQYWHWYNWMLLILQSFLALPLRSPYGLLLVLIKCIDTKRCDGHEFCVQNGGT